MADSAAEALPAEKVELPDDFFYEKENLVRVADKDSLFCMRGELMRAHRTLVRQHPGCIEEACAKFEQSRSKGPGPGKKGNRR